MPMAQASTTPAHTSSQAASLALLRISNPSPRLGPGKYSAITAPIMLSVVLIFRPLKMYGSALGTCSFQNTVQAFAAYERSSSRERGS